MGTANVGRSWPMASSTLPIRLSEQGPCQSGEVVLSHGSHWESRSNRGAQGNERVCKTEQAGGVGPQGMPQEVADTRIKGIVRS